MRALARMALVLVCLGWAAPLARQGLPRQPGHNDAKLVALSRLSASRAGAPLELHLKQGILTAREGRRLVTALSGLRLAGIDTSGKLVSLRLEAIHPQADRELPLYRFSYWNERRRSWMSPCLPDVHGNTDALLLEGVWDESGRYHPDADRFTLACTSGAIGKCARWGYKPWAEVNGRSLRPFHEACTRMVRADYSGDGSTFTRNGTPVFFVDTLGIRHAAPPRGMQLEAAWSAEGATQFFRPRYVRLMPGKVRPHPGTTLLVNYSYPR